MARIFVTDDTAVILQLYDDLLSTEGHEVYLDADSTLDRDYVEQFAPALIIFDYLSGQEASGMVMVQQLLMRPSIAVGQSSMKHRWTWRTWSVKRSWTCRTTKRTPGTHTPLIVKHSLAKWCIR